MKKLFILSAALMLGIIATWAQNGLSFTIYPQNTGKFSIWYSTFNAPSTNALQVDWGDGTLQVYNDIVKTGSDPSKKIEGNVTVNKPIKIYSDCIDAIWIQSVAKAIRCEANNPYIEFIYYFNSNFNPEDYEALYNSLNDRSGKSKWGELHLSEVSSAANASTRLLKSNAFIPLSKKWYVCSNKTWEGSFSERTNWHLTESMAYSVLIPAITLKTPGLANMTDFQIGIMDSPDLPYFVTKSMIRIDDGTNNHQSLMVSRYSTNDNFVNNAPKLTVKGTGIPGIINIYGAMVSHIKTSQISSLDLTNIRNMRYLNVNHCGNLTSIPGLSSQKSLSQLLLFSNPSITSLDLRELTALKSLSVHGCKRLEQLLFNTTNLERLDMGMCNKLPPGSISSLNAASKLTLIQAENMGWDACALDDMYSDLRTPAPSGARIYVDHEEYEGENLNDYAGSNKTIATNKGWSVLRTNTAGAIITNTGDGGGCKTVGPSSLSFTIYPEAAGTFTIWYSTHTEPSAKTVHVDWGDGELQVYSDIAETGSNPTKKIEGTAPAGKSIKVYSDCIEAIYISSKAKAFRCETNNPHLQYIYYLHDNLIPEDLEALYRSLNYRSIHENWGELHLSELRDFSSNILKSNAFIALDKHWKICSFNSLEGSFSNRTKSSIDEVNALVKLIPAITLQTPTLDNLTSLQIGIMDSPKLPWFVNTSMIRIEDGTNNHKSLEVSRYQTSFDFRSNAPKLTVKGTGEAGLIKIYGAMVSHIKMDKISSLDLTNATNLRDLSVSYSNKLTAIPGLSSQKLLEYVNFHGTNINEIDVRKSSKIKSLGASHCEYLNKLLFDTENLEALYIAGSYGIPLVDLSVVANAPKLTRISAAYLDWDACDLDIMYSYLRSPAPSGAEISVEDTELEMYYGTPNDWEGSNKTIATDKGWTVIREYNAGAEESLTGDGGGCFPESIGESEADKLITVYPNPADNVVNVTIGQNLNAESLQVIDITGKTIFIVPLTPFEFEHQIDVSDYAKGMYLIRIGNMTSKLFVK